MFRAEADLREIERRVGADRFMRVHNLDKFTAAVRAEQERRRRELGRDVVQAEKLVAASHAARNAALVASASEAIGHPRRWGCAPDSRLPGGSGECHVQYMACSLPL